MPLTSFKGIIITIRKVISMNKFYRVDHEQSPTTKLSYNLKDKTAKKGSINGTVIGSTNKFVAILWENSSVAEIISLQPATRTNNTYFNAAGYARYLAKQKQKSVRG